MPNAFNVNVTFEGTEPERLQAIQASAANLCGKMMTPGSEECVWNLADSVWPALKMPEYSGKPVNDITLRLVPLTRLGLMEGKSGSLVLIGYLADAADATRPHSHPIVVKTLSIKQRDKLHEEYENARSIKPFAYDQKDNVAIPIFFDSGQVGFNVLWSIFSPSGSVWPDGVADSSTTRLNVKDLREPLERGEDEKAQNVLDTTFRLLRNLHFRLNKAYSDERVFGEEYLRYLRKLDEGDWGDEWKASWGACDTQHVEDAGGCFTNPFWLLEKLRPLRKLLRIGAIHGDLHPGNIVLTGEQPRIIDFGWAKDGAHIAKDFALLECNLRFHTVRPQVNQRDVYALSDWIAWGAPLPPTLGPYAKRRAELIQHLRSKAKEVLTSSDRDTQWDWEYLVPLFFVAFGLLRYAPQLGNQQAAVRFVLALATHINTLLSKEE